MLIYATGTDGRITWLEVGVGDIFGWSAQSNFVQASFAPAPPRSPAAPTVPAPSPSPVAPPTGGAALDFQAQTVLGFGIGYISLDQVLAATSAQLGPVTNDTGWSPEVPADPEDGCTGSPPLRTLSWGDLSITFAQQHQPGSSAALSEFLERWSVGDPAVLSFGAGFGTNPPAAPTGLRTAGGIGIGSTIESVRAAYGEEFQFANVGAQAVYGNVNPTNSMAIALLTVAGDVTGIGTALIAC